jgi:Nucleotidyltransferase
MVICLSSQYAGEPFEKSYAVNPTTGEEIKLSFDLNFSRDELRAACNGEDDYSDALLKPCNAMISIGHPASLDRERRRVFERAVATAMDELGGEADIEYFARLIEALDPWLDQVVIIGGWAHRLYRLHPLAQPLDYEPLGTLDTDVAVPLNLPATGEQLHTRLLEKEFREELMGDTQPPAANYRVQTGDSGVYAEFLTPLEGSEIKRGGRRDITARV